MKPRVRTSDHLSVSEQGFTLIELLVVVSIIGILASVVLSSVGTARSKAKDTAIKAQVAQLRAVMEQNANDYGGSYQNLQTNKWVTSTATCANVVTVGTYAAKVQDICNQIMANEVGSGKTNVLYLGVNQSTHPGYRQYSILVWLPGQNSYWCVGSSGAISYDPGTWNNPGCYNNP